MIRHAAVVILAFWFANCLTVVDAAEQGTVPDPSNLGMTRQPLVASQTVVVPTQAFSETNTLPTEKPTSRRTVVESMLTSIDSLELGDLSSDDEGEAESQAPFWESWTSPQRIGGTVRMAAIMAALSLAPAMLLMTTCYIRLVVVLGLLRQALGSQQLPPNQVTTTLAVFLTGLIMWPVWSQVHEHAIAPYSNPDVEMSAEQAWQQGVQPVRGFMIEQIRRAGNGPDVVMFLEYLDITAVQSNSRIPLQALLPAFVISELKVAFLIGFQIYLPFVLLDLVVSSVTMSMGMVMVPPSTISLPLKLILFVLVDGWHLVVEMLLMSFG